MFFFLIFLKSGENQNQIFFFSFHRHLMFLSQEIRNSSMTIAVLLRSFPLRMQKDPVLILTK